MDGKHVCEFFSYRWPGHSVDTLRLRVASYLGPAQLPVVCNTEMQKQLGGSGGMPSPKNLRYEPACARSVKSL